MRRDGIKNVSVASQSLQVRVVTDPLRNRHRIDVPVVQRGVVKIRDQISIPFTGPRVIRRLVGAVLLDDGVDLLMCREDMRRGTPIYARADADVADVMAALVAIGVFVVPVVNGREVLGLFELSGPRPGRPQLA